MNLLQFLKPTNSEAEQEKFLSSRTYNPVFSYNWDRGEIDSWLSHPTQQKYHALTDAILNQDHPAIVEEAKKIFSTDMKESLLKKAEAIIEQSRQELNTQSMDDLVISYEETFKYFGIEYRIILSDERGFAARPSHSNRTLTLNKQLSLKYDSCAGLTRHEVLHIIRAINSEYNGIEKSHDYLPTEEGLACFVQDYKGTEENYSLYQHASRYVVTKVSLEGSFRDIVEFLCDRGFDRTLAYRRAVRHKFGFIDTSKPGDIMKSSMYFYNLYKIQLLSDSEILRLMVGKIALDELPQYPLYIGKIDESKLTDYFQLQSSNLTLSHSI